MGRKGGNSPTTHFCHHAVAWIDLLSQKEALKKLRDIPVTPEENEAFIQALKGTFGEVRVLRGLIRKYYKGRATAPSLPDWLPDHVRTRMLELRQERIGLHGVADAMALYVPLSGDDAAAVWDVQTLLYSCAAMMLIAVFRKQVIRGGIDIGIGGQVEKGEIYGPALSRAYTLESQEAEYPRILIGDECLRYLLTLSVLEGKDDDSRLAREVAGKCLDEIIVDDDGKRILHYLSPGQRRLMPTGFKPGFVESELKKGYRFITSEMNRFRKVGNEKLAIRYGRMKAYFDVYMPDWLRGGAPPRLHE